MRFTIRDILWLTALVAVACAGAINSSRLTWNLEKANADRQAAERDAVTWRLGYEMRLARQLPTE